MGKIGRRQKQVSRTPNESVAQPKSCYCGGIAGHTVGECRHKESVCHRCNKRGHLAKVCHLKNRKKGVARECGGKKQWVGTDKSENKDPQDAAVFQFGTGTIVYTFCVMPSEEERKKEEEVERR